MVQDLPRLGCDLSRTVLLDDSPFSFLMQPSNGLPIRPFSGEASDNDLLAVRGVDETMMWLYMHALMYRKRWQ